jgi:Tfp pilus assembly protein PilV
VKLNQLGQSLLEMTIAIGVGVIVLSVMTIITLTGLKNSEFSQNQANATKLAQDGLEQVRAIRDRDQDGSVCMNPLPAGWVHDDWKGPSSSGGTEFWSYACSGGACTFTLNSSGGLCSAVGTAAATPYLQLSAAGELLNNRFTRKIIIQDNTPPNTDVKNVTSQVTWTDSSGQHQVNLSTILSNPVTQKPIY